MKNSTKARCILLCSTEIYNNKKKKKEEEGVNKKNHKPEQERKLMAVFKKNDGGKYRKQSIAHSALYRPDRNFTVS